MGIRVINVQVPKQGADNEVFFIADERGNEYVIKVGNSAMNDVSALNLIQEIQLGIPVPKFYGHFTFEDKTVLILEKINFPLLESTSVDTQHLYINSMVENLNKIHSIKSEKAGLPAENGRTMSWQELLLFRYSGKHLWLDWNSIIHREGVETRLIQTSIERITSEIEHQELIQSSYSFLHTDFNQRNLFVDPVTKKLAGIIDWTESMFGDPLYDFARVRMYIWHFNLKHHALETLYKLIEITEEEKKLMELYFVNLIIEYIAWYSEAKSDSNNARLRLHQQFLRDYKW